MKLLLSKTRELDMDSINERINKLISAGLEVPYIFKILLKQETVLTEDVEILDIIYLEREYADERTRSGSILSPALLVIATVKGVIIVQEGKEDINTDRGGYKIRFIPHKSILAIEIDSLVINSNLTLFISGESLNVKIGFNRSRYYEDFERIVKIIKNRI